ncbi:MAG: GNAT family N-acetyltransferase [Pseudonocardiales bacterium]
MTVTEHPAGYPLRRPLIADLPGIHRLLADHDTALIGYPDVTEDDVRDLFTMPGFDPAADGWLATDPGGGVVGFAWASRRGTSADVDIEFYTHPGGEPSLASCLLTLVEQRGAEIGRELGHANVRTLTGCYRSALDEAALLAERGYTVATTFHRMSVDLPAALPDPPVPSGVRVLVCGADEELLRAVHGVKEISFRGHFGTVPQTYEEWHDHYAARSGTDWSQVWLAELDDEPAGMLMATDSFVETDNAGYVHNLGVHPRARGRGVAKLLLRTAFAEMARRGRTGALLGVDTGNSTGALGLYESVGMRPTLEIDVWRKTISLT